MEKQKNTWEGQHENTPQEGSEKLIQKYKINDEAFRQSSKEEFVKTVSKFHHNDETSEQNKEK